MVYVVHASGTKAVGCNRCQQEIDYEHFHCQQCVANYSVAGSCFTGYDICPDCAEDGIYCNNDTHTFMEYVIDYNIGRRRAVGGDITASDAIKRLAEKPYPSILQRHPWSGTPEELFSPEDRFIRKDNRRQILVYTDGSCLGNGQDDPRAGWAIYYRPSAYSQGGVLTYSGTVSGRLEKKGPFGHIYQETSNRAELRAVIHALHFRDWSADGNRSWRSVVIATDSEYVAINATSRVELWEKLGWTLSSGKPVQNMDLWKLLLLEIRSLHSKGVSVSFWNIPRAWNARADEFAKEGANSPELLQFTECQADGLLRTTSNQALYEGYPAPGVLFSFCEGFKLRKSTHVQYILK